MKTLGRRAYEVETAQARPGKGPDRCDTHNNLFWKGTVVAQSDLWQKLQPGELN